MKKLSLAFVAVVVLFSAGWASAEITISLVPDFVVVGLGQDFNVDVVVTTDVALAGIQVVFDNLDPSLELKEVVAPLSDLSFINPPDTVAIDFFPNTQPAFVPGTFTVGTLTFGTSALGLFPLDLFLENGSTLSTAVFEELYLPNWDVIVVGGAVNVIPEPATIGLIALVGLGAVVRRRK